MQIREQIKTKTIQVPVNNIQTGTQVSDYGFWRGDGILSGEGSLGRDGVLIGDGSLGNDDKLSGDGEAASSILTSPYGH